MNYTTRLRISSVSSEADALRIKGWTEIEYEDGKVTHLECTLAATPALANKLHVGYEIKVTLEIP